MGFGFTQRQWPVGSTALCNDCGLDIYFTIIDNIAQWLHDTGKRTCESVANGGVATPIERGNR
jgi:hypothetical protein